MSSPLVKVYKLLNKLLNSLKFKRKIFMPAPLVKVDKSSVSRAVTPSFRLHRGGVQKSFGIICDFSVDWLYKHVFNHRR